MSETDEETRWLSKDALRELVEGAGGKWAASIGPKVDIVVLGDLRRERSDKKGDTWKGSKKADALAEQRRLSEPDAAGSVPRKRGPAGRSTLRRISGRHEYTHRGQSQVDAEQVPAHF